MALTTTKGYPYPQDADAADVPYHVQQLATAVDSSPGISMLSQAAIDALSVDMKWAGRVVYNTTAGVLQQSNGSTFSSIVTGASSGLNPFLLMGA